MTAEDRIRNYLTTLYGKPAAEDAWSQISASLENFRCQVQHVFRYDQHLTENDAILITYGDSFIGHGEPPLRSLAQFVEKWLGEAISGLHILPFYPFSSDDGFSVIDYRQVDPRLGNWHDIASLATHYRMMFDGVINHVSQHSAWFQAYLRGEAPYRDYFIDAQPDWDLSMVARPRTLPLLTEFETNAGRRQVWTTFSADQVDLNYANPQVLVEITSLLLDYVLHGAAMIRLDAIAYLWKEAGTSCIHLTQTHLVIKLLRAVLDLAAPQVLLISETNVPHHENISYFGQLNRETGRTDEAQLVYQFPLAPLILHTFAAQDATRLSQWAATLEGPGMFFNFIASHDGIGLQPARDLLPPGELQNLVECALAHGGLVSYKTDAGGEQIPYELNITLYDALNDPQQPEPDSDRRRFLASQCIMLALAGVPGIYVHSLFGSHNCHACVQESGRARSINRERFDFEALDAELHEGHSQRARIFFEFRRLLELRREQAAFHPDGSQRVLALDPAVFALVRNAPSGAAPLLCLVNVSPVRHSLCINAGEHALPEACAWRDLFTGQIFRQVRSILEVSLDAYQCLWLVPSGTV